MSEAIGRAVKVSDATESVGEIGVQSKPSLAIPDHVPSSPIDIPLDANACEAFSPLLSRIGSKSCQFAVNRESATCSRFASGAAKSDIASEGYSAAGMLCESMLVAGEAG